MKVDTALLESLIRSGVENVCSDSTPWIDEKVVLGELRGVQIQLYVTRDEDDFIDSQLPNGSCVTE